jgi:photosystem II stability/assembly factor-like uncharacterized protein
MNTVRKLAGIVLVAMSLILAVCCTSARALSLTAEHRVQPAAARLASRLRLALEAVHTVTSVSCPDSTHCWAGGVAGSDEGVILASTDGGVRWRVQATFSGVNEVNTLECPSDSHCWGAGDRVVSNRSPLLLATSDGGRVWTERTTSRGVAQLDGISCANDTDCWAVEQSPTDEATVIATSDGGKSWAKERTPALEVAMGVSLGISCPSRKDCVVVGESALTTSDGGSTWKEHPVPGDLNFLACASTHQCVAVENATSAIPSHESSAIATSSDGGENWTERVNKLGGGVVNLLSLSCQTASACVAVGKGYTSTKASPNNYVLWGAVERTSDGGGTWQLTRETTLTSLMGVSCATETTDCVAVGTTSLTNKGRGIILRSVNSGTTWKEERVPAASPSSAAPSL